MIKKILKIIVILSLVCYFALILVGKLKLNLYEDWCIESVVSLQNDTYEFGSATSSFYVKGKVYRDVFDSCVTFFGNM